MSEIALTSDIYSDVTNKRADQNKQVWWKKNANSLAYLPNKSILTSIVVFFVYSKASRYADFGSRKKNVQLKTVLHEVYTYALNLESMFWIS